MLSQTTLSEQKMRKQILFIYQNLVRSGYPQLINKDILKTHQQISQLLSQYFQPTPNRQHLIQWLILQIYPLYQRQIDKVDKKINRKRKILTYLWKLGVMPFSKHTKNLDYEKYLQGLIGIQNSINLIFNLCTLLTDSKRYSKSKQDSQFHYFLQDIYSNYDSLVNIDYDPYKISFPPAYQQLNDEQFNSQYASFLKEKIQKLREDKRQALLNDNRSFQLVFKDFEQNKNQFLKTYSLITDKIKTTIVQNRNLLQNHKELESKQSKGRIINISYNLPKLYKQYKQKTRLLSYPQSKLIQQKQSIIKLIGILNQQVLI